MSKSGVFAHFGSREELQISVVREYHAKFEEEVFFPALKRAARPAAPARAVRALGQARLGRDRLGLHLHQRRGRVRRPARPGARCAGDDGAGLAARARTRDAAWRSTTATCAPTPTPQQMVFEMHGLILALHHDARFLRHPGAVDRARTGFERLVARLRDADRLQSIAPGSQHAAAARAAARHALDFTFSFSLQELPWPSTPRRCATCSSCCTKCSTSSTN